MPTETTIQMPQPQQVTTLEKIRPELNLEKWSVWQPTQSRQPLKTKIFQREIALQDGSKITAKVKIAPTTDGALNTEDQKTYYALVKQWEERGKSAEYTSFSLRRISKFLKKKWGSDAIETISNSLMRLRGTLFTWENSFFDKSTSETIEFLDTFNILSELKIVRRKKDGVVNTEVGYFRFNDFILKNLQANHTKPVFFDVVVNFKSEIAQLLYTHLDLIFASDNKPLYERRTKELFEELGIFGTAYNQRSNRKQKLNPALAELTGVPLSKSGFIAAATLEETKDRKDYKVIFRKGSARPHLKPPASADPEKITDTATDRGVVERVVSAPASFTPTNATPEHVEELLRHFKTVFAETAKTKPSSKHHHLAASLISQHGLACLKFAVEYAHHQAQKTNFSIATFGGISQYVPDAVSKYTQRRHEEDQAATHQANAEHQRQLEDAHLQYKQAIINNHVATIGTEHHRALIESKNRELLTKNHALYARWSADALNDMSARLVSADILASIPHLSFEEFCSQYDRPADPPPRPDEL